MLFPSTMQHSHVLTNGRLPVIDIPAETSKAADPKTHIAG